MNLQTREITKEQFEEFNETREASLFFSDAVLMGYGLYYLKAYEKDGKYFIDYEIGSSCD